MLEYWELLHRAKSIGQSEKTSCAMYLAYFNSMYEEETQASIKHLLPRLSSVQLCNVRVQIANKVITTIVWQELCHYVQVKMG